MTTWFDVEDLYHHLRGGHRRMSGIQRLTFEIYQAAHAIGGVGFVRHDDGPDRFQVVDWPWIVAAFDAAAGPEDEDPPAATDTQAPAPGSPPTPLSAPLPAPIAAPLPAPASRTAARTAARRVANALPDHVRRPLVLAAVMQAEAAAELARFTWRAARHVLSRPAPASQKRRPPPLPGLPAATLHPPFATLAQPGDTLLVLGSPWFRADYSQLARWARDDLRMRFGVLVHDLVPLRRPEWSHAGVTRTFKDWYADVLPLCDLVLANSRHTANDVEAYAREIGIALRRPVRPVPVGTGFGPANTTPPGPTPIPGPYVLFVSTMEARKNHALAVRVWRRLLNEEQAGARPRNSTPTLVFAGRVGWLVADLIQQLDNTAWLDGRIHMVQDPSDATLRALYAGCLFTIFPSLHEGWGLPVTESLALGTPCLSSDAGALPEAGGALGRYFDPEDLDAAYQAVAALLDDRQALDAWRAQVRRDFRPTPWADTAAAVLDEAARAA